MWMGMQPQRRVGQRADVPRGLRLRGGALALLFSIVWRPVCSGASRRLCVVWAKSTSRRSQHTFCLTAFLIDLIFQYMLNDQFKARRHDVNTQCSPVQQSWPASPVGEPRPLTHTEAHTAPTCRAFTDRRSVGTAKVISF
jgi:hypothetical protein